MENKYITLVHEGLTIQAKLDDEGVVLDVFKNDEVVATTWKTYDEFGVTLEHQK
jgi:hypothetical protein